MTEAYTVPVTAEDRLKAGVAAHLVAARTGTRADGMTAGGRLDPKASRARWLAMYLSHVSFGWSLERVGHVFGLNRATAGAACRWAEDARDEGGVDDLLSHLETCLTDLFRAPRCELRG